jgi:hypothetical protein
MATTLFEQMKRDAAARRFDRLLVWKVSRLGRDMRELISTVYELSDLGVTMIPHQISDRPDHFHRGSAALGHPGVVHGDGERRTVRVNSRGTRAGKGQRKADRTAAPGV